MTGTRGQSDEEEDGGRESQKPRLSHQSSSLSLVSSSSVKKKKLFLSVSPGLSMPKIHRMKEWRDGEKDAM